MLVDVTADWCITCQVNKAAVLNRDPIATLLEDGVIGLGFARIGVGSNDPLPIFFMAQAPREAVPAVEVARRFS